MSRKVIRKKSKETTGEKLERVGEWLVHGMYNAHEFICSIPTKIITDGTRNCISIEIPNWLKREKMCWFWLGEASERTIGEVHSQGESYGVCSENLTDSRETLTRSVDTYHTALGRDAVPGTEGDSSSRKQEQGESRQLQPDSQVTLPDSFAAHADWVWSGERAGEREHMHCWKERDHVFLPIPQQGHVVQPGDNVSSFFF